jgi:putative membrane protein
VTGALDDGAAITGGPVAGDPVPDGGPVPGSAPVPGGGAVAGGGAGEAAAPRRRLHPLSPLLHSAKALTFIVAAISWQGYQSLGPTTWAGVVLLLLLGAGALSVVSWYVTGYHIVGRELRVYEGVLWRRSRAIPLERLQSVEVVRPLLAQLTGLAELRLEVVGGAKTEAPLAYLTRAEAAALRDRLLSLAGRLAPAPAAVAADGVPAPATRAARPLHAVSNKDLVIGQLLTPQMWSLPFAIAFVVAQTVLANSWTFVGVASTLTAMAGILLQPARRVLRDWNFTLLRDATGLRLRHGLLEARSQIVPLDRLQAVRATWPLLWRPVGWLRMRMDVAGYAGPEQGESQVADQLLPVGDLATGRRLLAEVLPGPDLAELRLTAPPSRARWLAPIAQPRLGMTLTPEVFATSDGVLTRNLTLVPYARIQSVRLVQGPVQRLLGLATVRADTAGGLHGAAAHRDLAEARQVAAELSDRAEAARAHGATPATH